MHPALRIDDLTDLPNAQPKRRVLKRLLHLPWAKPAQVSIVFMRRTIRVLARKRPERVRARPDLRLISP
jgi:hypothetical protein